jgi:hypothetical protein
MELMGNCRAFTGMAQKMSAFYGDSAKTCKGNGKRNRDDAEEIRIFVRVIRGEDQAISRCDAACETRAGMGV